MTSATIGLPDRYRPLDQVGLDEPTPTGVIRCWRAKDRVLNRDVAVRVHTPAGAAAHAWITRALTAGGLATPALAMVYDASEGGGDPGRGGGAAYVVNEWIDGETLADRLTRGPLPERETRTVLRRLAEGVAEAHRVGLAVGGLTPENVVLRPNGLVGLRAVPAATGSIQGDITALGELLEACLTGRSATGAAAALTGPPDLVALARRARSAEPGQGLGSVAAMAALLGERPRSGASPSVPLGRGDDSDGGWLRRLRERRAESEDVAAPTPTATAVASTPAPGGGDVDEAPVRLDPHTLPPVPSVHPLPAQTPIVPGGDTIDVSQVPSSGRHARPEAPHAGPASAGTQDAGYPYAGPDTRSDSPFGVLGDDPYTGEEYVGDPYPDRPLLDTGVLPASRRRLAVIGLPLLALAVVIALAWWLGTNVLSVAGSIDDAQGSTPSVSRSAAPSTGQAATGTPITIVSGAVFDPFGDGAPENDKDVPLSFDGNPSTDWSTLTYRGSPAFGNLKPGVGVLYDLGSPQPLASVTVASPTPGATVEIRAGDNPQGSLDSFAVAAHGTLQRSTELAFDKPVTARYLLVWLTGLVNQGDGFSAGIAEVSVRSAG
jgi:eukaryotic-like serine/threonine-protein kinase